MVISYELWGIVPQMRQATALISSNIAEGAARNSHKEFNVLPYY